MFDLEDPDEIAAFYELDSDRGVAVVGAAIVENRLTALLKAAMRQDKEALEEMFRSTGPLGTFGSKIATAYLFGLIHQDIYNDLKAISKIRNMFAHEVKTKSFKDSHVKDRIKSLRAFSVWKAVYERDKDKIHDSSADHFTRVAAQIVRDDLETPRDSFRMCLRLYIYKLVKTEKEIAAKARESRGTSDNG